MDVVVDMADLGVSDDPRVDLLTYSLGSCMGVAIWDPKARVGGLLHYMLPESSIAPEKAQGNPAMFADTGVPALFHALCELGAVKDRIVVKVAGGSSLLDDNGMFNIGQRNYLMLRKLFWRNGIQIVAEHVGGSLSRTLRLSIGAGRVTIKNRNGEVEL